MNISKTIKFESHQQLCDFLNFIVKNEVIDCQALVSIGFLKDPDPDMTNDDWEYPEIILPEHLNPEFELGTYYISFQNSFDRLGNFEIRTVVRVDNPPTVEEWIKLSSDLLVKDLAAYGNELEDKTGLSYY